MRQPATNEWKVSPFFVFFLLYASMVEIGVLNYQKALMQYAGYNAWMSIPITGISIHIVIWMMYQICSSKGEMGIYEINQHYFGKWLGIALNAAIVCYFAFGAFITFRVYLAIIQYMLFPEMSLLSISLIFVILLYYTVSGGFRTIVGICFWGVLFSFAFIIPLNLLGLSYLHLQNLFPLWNHSTADLLHSAKSMVFQYLGIEAILVYYPFIQTPAKSQKWAHWTVLLVTVYYLITILITFMYYSEIQLQKVIWPTLHRVSLLKLPLIQRLEYLVVSVLFIKIVACIALGLWAACRGAKLSLRMKQPISLILILAVFLVLVFFVKDMILIKRMSGFYESTGFYFIYAYVPLLFVLTRIRKIGKA
ncbi:GerAB/ArcD/ProY family transporter [Paenibacillus qinlingensis]|uniref:GerAB/ArcD/ProY family transporter n=1 Tax=Paenibacillus qinlingensis TaxID=1837343 RepID=UPI001564AA6C|nr:GerAB/ArcD/ProY family transporter [Paenibacillus qinlingensis]NQX62742.1 GerAB/ArcD/ProY family transporter [Paenibacillus qinlingensis]